MGARWPVLGVAFGEGGDTLPEGIATPPPRADSPCWGGCGGVAGGGGRFDFNFIAEQLIHGWLSPPVTPVMTFHHDEKWNDTAHYSCRSLSLHGGGGPPPPPDSERWPPLITPPPPGTASPIHSRQSLAPLAILGCTGTYWVGRGWSPLASPGRGLPHPLHVIYWPHLPRQAIGPCVSLDPPLATLQLLIGLTLLWV